MIRERHDENVMIKRRKVTDFSLSRSPSHVKGRLSSHVAAQIKVLLMLCFGKMRKFAASFNQ